MKELAGGEELTWSLEEGGVNVVTRGEGVNVVAGGGGVEVEELM